MTAPGWVDKQLGSTPKVESPFTILRRHVLAANCDVPVLLSCGRSGQAERLASWIHQRSARRAAPFLVMDGRRRGIPTAVMAALRRVEVGTLFIAHVDKLPLAMQVALFQFLERPERRHGVGLRLIGGSDGSALQRIRSGHFSADLYYRLNLIHIAIR